MITIGVDFSKRTSSYHVLDEKGQTFKRCKVANDPELIDQFFKSLPEEPKQLTMEATWNWGIYYEAVLPYVDHFYLGHPKKMRAITESETKNDQKDAEMIARLTYSGFLPKAHICPINIRQLRSLLRFRGFLVENRKAIRNQVHTLLDRNIWPLDRPLSFKSPFCIRGLKWLKDLVLPQRERFILDQALATYGDLSQRISDLEDYIQAQTVDLPGLKHLRTVPGFRTSKVNAFMVLLEADDVTRFRKARGFAHYAGLVPQEYSSGDTHRTGRLVKGANKHLRTAIVESTLSAIRMDTGLRAYYKQVQARRGSGPAIIATARKLSYAIYFVLKEKRAYRPEVVPPAAVCSLNAAP